MSTPTLAMIPSGRKATKLYSVLPTDGTGDFTVARAGLRNEINSDLKLELIAANVPAFNHDTVGGCPVLNTEPQATNLITYPISFGNSYWTKSGASIEGDASTVGSELVTNGTFTGSAASWTLQTGWSYGSDSVSKTSGVASFLLQPSILTIGDLYKVTFTISNYISGVFGLYSTFWEQQHLYSANGTYEVYSSSKSLNLYLYSDASFVGSIDNVSVKPVQGYSAPSVDFPTSAFKLVEDGTTGNHRVYSGVATTTISNNYTSSIFAKAGERSWIEIIFGNGAGAYFDLENGVLGTVDSGVTGKIKELANGWYKCSISYSVILASERSYIYLADANASDSYTGDGTSGVYIYGAQVETGKVATSPTFTDTTLAAEGIISTRLADVVTGAGDVNTFNSLEGVLYAEIAALSDDLTYRRISVNDASVNNRIGISYDDVSNRIRGQIVIGGVSIFLFFTSTDITQYSKIALKYKTNDFALWVDGIERDTDISAGVLPSNTLNNLSFDNGGSGNVFNGKVKQLQVYNTALSDAELAALTTL